MSTGEGLEEHENTTTDDEVWHARDASVRDPVATRQPSDETESLRQQFRENILSVNSVPLRTIVGQVMTPRTGEDHRRTDDRASERRSFADPGAQTTQSAPNCLSGGQKSADLHGALSKRLQILGRGGRVVRLAQASTESSVTALRGSPTSSDDGGPASETILAETFVKKENLNSVGDENLETAPVTQAQSGQGLDSRESRFQSSSALGKSNLMRGRRVDPSTEFPALVRNEKRLSNYVDSDTQDSCPPKDTVTTLRKAEAMASRPRATVHSNASGETHDYDISPDGAIERRDMRKTEAALSDWTADPNEEMDFDAPLDVGVIDHSTRGTETKRPKESGKPETKATLRAAIKAVEWTDLEDDELDTPASTVGVISQKIPDTTNSARSRPALEEQGYRRPFATTLTPERWAAGDGATENVVKRVSEELRILEEQKEIVKHRVEERARLRREEDARIEKEQKERALQKLQELEARLDLKKAAEHTAKSAGDPTSNRVSAKKGGATPSWSTSHHTQRVPSTATHPTRGASRYQPVTSTDCSGEMFATARSQDNRIERAAQRMAPATSIDTLGFEREYGASLTPTLQADSNRVQRNKSIGSTNTPMIDGKGKLHHSNIANVSQTSHEPVRLETHHRNSSDAPRRPHGVGRVQEPRTASRRNTGPPSVEQKTWVRNHSAGQRWNDQERDISTSTRQQPLPKDSMDRYSSISESPVIDDRSLRTTRREKRQWAREPRSLVPHERITGEDTQLGNSSTSATDRTRQVDSENVISTVQQSSIESSPKWQLSSFERPSFEDITRAFATDPGGIRGKTGLMSIGSTYAHNSAAGRAAMISEKINYHTSTGQLEENARGANSAYHVGDESSVARADHGSALNAKQVPLRAGSPDASQNESDAGNANELGHFISEQAAVEQQEPKTSSANERHVTRSIERQGNVRSQASQEPPGSTDQPSATRPEQLPHIHQENVSMEPRMLHSDLRMDAPEFVPPSHLEADMTGALDMASVETFAIGHRRAFAADRGATDARQRSPGGQDSRHHHHRAHHFVDDDEDDEDVAAAAVSSALGERHLRHQPLRSRPSNHVASRQGGASRTRSMTKVDSPESRSKKSVPPARTESYHRATSFNTASREYPSQKEPDTKGAYFNQPGGHHGTHKSLMKTGPDVQPIEGGSQVSLRRKKSRHRKKITERPRPETQATQAIESEMAVVHLGDETKPAVSSTGFDSDRASADQHRPVKSAKEKVLSSTVPDAHALKAKIQDPLPQSRDKAREKSTIENHPSDGRARRKTSRRSKALRRTEAHQPVQMNANVEPTNESIPSMQATSSSPSAAAGGSVGEWNDSMDVGEPISSPAADSTPATTSSRMNNTVSDKKSAHGGVRRTNRPNVATLRARKRNGKPSDSALSASFPASSD